MQNITKADRNKLNLHKGMVVWLTGLSGAGKSTLANELEKELFAMGLRTYILDGDNIRAGLNKDLSFTEEGRKENIRRIGEVAKLFLDAGLIVIVAFISPYIEDRKMAREIMGENEFVEVFVNCPLEICEQRDVKCLYQKVRMGMIKNFTGIDSNYEIPLCPDITVNTHQQSITECVNKIMETILQVINLK